MELRIYNDIVDEEDKAFLQFLGTDGVCFKDINDFCNQIPEDDKDINLRIHCRGGSVLEGWAIYDRLRATGKNISAVVEGTCASMATIILLSAPKENRKASQNSHFLCHNPYTSPFALPANTTADDLQKMADDMKAEQERILDLYVERCGCDREEMQALMNEDKMIDASKAKELGLISEIVMPLSAKFNNSNNTMSEKKNFIEKLVNLFKGAVESAFAMSLDTADGQVITIEREEGMPAVGDKASPDGEFVMPDGSTIIVSNGEIVEIKPATPEETEEEAEAKVEEDTKEEEVDPKAEETEEPEKPAEEEDEKDKKIAELEEENATLKERIAVLEEDLKSAEANAKSADDKKMLNALKMAGGLKALEKISSSYVVEQREQKENKADVNQKVLAKMQEIEERNKKK